MNSPKLSELLVRGLKARCPRCGKGRLFQSWNVLRDRCGECDLPLRAREDETWFFMYMSTAAITGIFIIAMFLIRPQNLLAGRIFIAFTAGGIFVVTTGPRKGIALALDYYVDSRSEHPRNPQ